ncbi:MAG: preprotein translocase subunit SecA [Firmicutes bacterium]|nr:preprotein translocase subunit SecA [Bacillota bacterium]
MSFLEKIFGDANSKEIKRIEKIVDRIEALEPSMQALSDEQLQAKTAEFRERLAKGETLDDLLVEAFAVCREASWRVLGMKHFRVQLIGGVVLHEGNIAEMKTGEGKTLVATLPVYLNALEGKGVHVVTVNDYLAKRDCDWMGQVYTWLGLTVGCIIHEVSGEDRKAAYNSDITYGTNNEFGFDYLRDNMAIYAKDEMQRELNYAIVDEVDSILIDEARTPLIISGKGEESSDLYNKADRFVRNLRPGEDFTMEEKDRTISLTEDGVAKAERYFGVENLADPDNMELSHHINAALKANNLMKRDVDYIVNEGEIVIVDEFTGRLMYGRRYSDGLHQAIEAKEGIKVRSESKTLATITLQNYFRMYNKLAGMTGTAKTEEDEFVDIYNMKVIVIPTNRPVQRQDLEDVVYTTAKGKYRAIVESIIEHHETGQPVLVGTISVEKSEMLSAMLQRRGIKHDVLNAKQHMREAEIVANAGREGTVTIATNMAGRGTDIILGGKDSTPEEQQRVKELGGLHIIGTERHEARRIDNQLRGRSGRQGDPGSSQFFVALDDDLMRLFGGERMQNMMERLAVDEDTPITAGVLTKQIESAQKKVEGRNYSTRKYVLQYDDVMNRQRSIIYAERKRVLRGENLKDYLLSMMKDIAGEIADYVAAGGEYPEQWDFDELNRKIDAINKIMPKPRYSEAEKQDLTRDKLADDIYEKMQAFYQEKENLIGSERMRELERVLLLWIVDRQWMDHIDAMDQLKHGIGLRSVGHEDPAMAYANEGSDMFELMVASIREEMVRNCLALTIQTDAQRRQVVSVGASVKDEIESAADAEKKRRGTAVSADKASPGQRIQGTDNSGVKAQPIRVQKMPGRNDPCWCGSGKKYKNCHGKVKNFVEE